MRGCHQHGGRGGRVGPDLTHLGQQQARERIIASILQPSREIAPHYQAWTLLTTDGLSHVGLRLPKGGDDGVEPYADPQGREFTLPSEEIELRSPSDMSIMPDGLGADADGRRSARPRGVSDGDRRSSRDYAAGR